MCSAFGMLLHNGMPWRTGSAGILRAPVADVSKQACDIVRCEACVYAMAATMSKAHTWDHDGCSCQSTHRVCYIILASCLAALLAFTTVSRRSCTA